MQLPENIIIDFDSTIIKLEALDELANLSLQNNPDKEKILEEVKHITDLGMKGEITFDESLSKRLKLFSTNKTCINNLIPILQENITESFRSNKKFLRKNKDRIYIVSGGFRDLIIPVIKNLELKEENTFANDFVFEGENVIGVNKNNYLAQDQGKVKLVRSLNLKGLTIIIGDGMTDYQIKENGYADEFYAFVEIKYREEVVKIADKKLANLDEFINVFKPSRSKLEVFKLWKFRI